MIRHQLIAHRGWQKCFPENTLLAVEKAIEVGAKHIEIDIQLTADHVPVLFHDLSLQRLCDESGKITEQRFDELSNLSAHEPGRFGTEFLGTPIATLSSCIDLITQHRDVTLYVEIKQESLDAFGHEIMLSTVLPLLENIQSQCFIISFNIDILKQCSCHQWNTLAPVLNHWEEAFSDAIKVLNPPLVFCDAKLFNDRTPEDLPYPCAIYEIANYSVAERLIAEGAALIESFNIGALIEKDVRHAE